MAKKKQYTLADLTPEARAQLTLAVREQVVPIVFDEVRKERAATEQRLKLWVTTPTKAAIKADKLYHSYWNAGRRAKVRYWAGQAWVKLWRLVGISVSTNTRPSPVHKLIDPATGGIRNNEELVRGLYGR